MTQKPLPPVLNGLGRANRSYRRSPSRSPSSAYYKLDVGRVGGGFAEQGLQYLMAVASFVAIGITFGLVNPVAMAGDLSAAAGEPGRLVGQRGDAVVRWLVNSLSGVMES